MKKLITLCLLVAMVTTSLIGCGVKDNSSDVSTTTTAAVSDNESSADVTTEKGLDVPDYDLGQRKIVFLVPETNGWVNSRDFDYNAESGGEPVNDAVNERIIIVEELFKCDIEPIHASKLIEDARKSIQAGDNAYDVIMPAMNEVSGLGHEGQLLNLNAISTIHLENLWWNQNANENLSVKHKLYYTLGDISLIDNDGIGAMCFNKEMVTSRGLDNPYELVHAGKWTLDTVQNMCKGVNSDLNGDGKMNKEDQWGFITDFSNTMGLLVSCDEQLVKKDADDVPYIAINNERAMAVIDRIILFMNDETAFGNHGTVYDDDQLLANKAFMNNKIMIRWTSLYRLTQQRDMESDFGILPVPKYDEAQEWYKHSLSYASPGVAIPVTQSTPQEIGAVVEALSYYGRQLLLPAYYDVTLQNKVARDTESGEMLDIIFDTSTFDLGLIYNFGGLRDMFTPFIKDKTNNFASSYAKIKDKAQKELDNLIELFEGLE